MIGEALRAARQASGLGQEEVARRAGVSRMTVQRLETGAIDPRESTLTLVARTLGLELVLVPSPLRAGVEHYVRAGGRALGQPPGIDAPPSIVDTLGPRTPPTLRKRR